MPLVFVHGVANRPGPDQIAETAQRNALFRAIVFRNDAVSIRNPDWGSAAADFTASMPWLPVPNGSQSFDASDPVLDGNRREVGLGNIAKTDGVQAADLAVLAALETAILEARTNPGAETEKDLIALARAVADYVEPQVSGPDPKGIVELAAATDAEFADALEAELQSRNAAQGHQAFGVSDRIRDAVGALGGWIGNAASDAVLKAKRRDLSRAVSFFLGDIFVYLRQRDVSGAQGTQARLFEPILKDLVLAAKDARAQREPFVVIGHSLGGVLLYDILTDPVSLARLEAEEPGFKIDALLTVGSQPGFFADMKMYGDRNGARLPRPRPVQVWMNVFDYTDVFSFLCQPIFFDVEDFGYDTSVDLFHAHSAYFKKPSFYKRLELRLKSLGYL
jgi:hypothetical protein